MSPGHYHISYQCIFKSFCIKILKASKWTCLGYSEHHQKPPRRCFVMALFTLKHVLKRPALKAFFPVASWWHCFAMQCHFTMVDSSTSQVHVNVLTCPKSAMTVVKVHPRHGCQHSLALTNYLSLLCGCGDHCCLGQVTSHQYSPRPSMKLLQCCQMHWCWSCRNYLQC